jgi:hypothetical protein
VPPGKPCFGIGSDARVSVPPGSRASVSAATPAQAKLRRGGWVCMTRTRARLRTRRRHFWIRRDSAAALAQTPPLLSRDRRSRRLLGSCKRPTEASDGMRASAGQDPRHCHEAGRLCRPSLTNALTIQPGSARRSPATEGTRQRAGADLGGQRPGRVLSGRALARPFGRAVYRWRSVGPERVAGSARTAWLLLGRSSHHVAPSNSAACGCFRTNRIT